MILEALGNLRQDSRSKAERWTKRRGMIGGILAELVEEAKAGTSKVSIGLMSYGSELGEGELVKGSPARHAERPSLNVVLVLKCGGGRNGMHETPACGRTYQGHGRRAPEA